MLYIYFYLFTHVTESFVTERLVTESWGLLLAPPPYFSVSCLKRFPDTPRIYTMVLQGFISIVSLSPLLSNLHRRILRSAIIACALQKKISKPPYFNSESETYFFFRLRQSSRIVLQDMCGLKALRLIQKGQDDMENALEFMFAQKENPPSGHTLQGTITYPIPSRYF